MMGGFVWRGRYDGDDTDNLRLWQVIKTTPYTQLQPYKSTDPAYALVGFQSDEGVRRNRGRCGAYDAPDSIRTALANLPYGGGYTVTDTGNIACVGTDLASAQRHLAHRMRTLIHHNHTPIVLGGGHETSFGGLMGVHRALPADKTIGIVNFDAHFDLRTTPDNTPTSGTPFSDTQRLFADDNRLFNYFCMGIAKSGNTPVLFKRADAMGVQYCYDTDCHMHPENCLQKLIDFVTCVDYIYITIDMDVFNGGIAPGVSAVNPMGIAPAFVHMCLHHIPGKNIIAVDIVECNPKYDRQNLTARLSAILIHTVVTIV